MIAAIILIVNQGLGSAGEVVAVKRGYARNFLIPKSIATYATKEQVKTYAALPKPEPTVADNDAKV